MLIEIPELNTKDIDAIERIFRRVYVGHDENEKQEYKSLEKLKPLITSILLTSKISKTLMSEHALYLPKLTGNDRASNTGHIIPLWPCALCGGDAQFIEDQYEMVWSAECKECGLTLGRYSSRLDLCIDWNKRAGLMFSLDDLAKMLSLVD